jgi:hypothetical protein
MVGIVRDKRLSEEKADSKEQKEEEEKLLTSHGKTKTNNSFTLSNTKYWKGLYKNGQTTTGGST